jgi:hypothetical protein
MECRTLTPLVRNDVAAAAACDADVAAADACNADDADH